MANYFTKGKLMKGMEIKKPLLLIWINKVAYLSLK